MPNKPGYINGSHYTEYVGQIKILKRDKRTNDAVALLLRCVDATEAESRSEGCGVAPHYYEQLAIIFRKEKRFADEVSILERYARQRKAPGSLPDKLATRLEKAKGLLSRNQA